MRAALYDDAVRDLPVRAAFLGAEGGVTGAALAAAQRGSVASIA
jgi:L-lactate utilization protein LutB